MFRRTAEKRRAQNTLAFRSVRYRGQGRVRKGEKLICNFNDRLFPTPTKRSSGRGENLMKRCCVRGERGSAVDAIVNDTPPG